MASTFIIATSLITQDNVINWLKYYILTFGISAAVLIGIYVK